MSKDPYLALIRLQWPHIAALYNQFAEHYPVMMYDVQEQQIYAYPFDEFRAQLNAPSQISVDEQYQRAIENRQMVLFVRDVEHKLFQSYSLALEE